MLLHHHTQFIDIFYNQQAIKLFVYTQPTASKEVTGKVRTDKEGVLGNEDPTGVPNKGCSQHEGPPC
jgi:hypothetical protein